MTAAHSPSPLRREDARLLQGRAQFVDNVHLDRMVHAVFVRSPLAHARIVSIDVSEALAAGALRVITAADLPFQDRPWVVRYWHPSIRGGMPTFLAADRVRFVGEPVALVVAADRYVAEDLAALVRVEYEELPPLASIDAATAPGAPRLHDDWEGNVAAAYRQTQGDAAAAMAAAKHRVRRRFEYGRQVPLPLETRGVVADWDEERAALTLWMSTQAHYNVRQNLATILDLPEHQVRVIAEDVGGGFGSKSRIFAEEIVLSHASRLVRRPVKWIEDRFEHLQATTHSRAITVDLALGCDANGRIDALEATISLDLGAYIFTSGIITAEVAAAHISNGYVAPNFAIDVRCVGTNKTPIATYRGAGQPEACYPIECLLDVVAKEIGLAGDELRRRNLVRPAALPYPVGTTLLGLRIGYESGDFPALLDLAVRESGYDERVIDAGGGRRVAWGLACGLEAGGLVNIETAHIRVDGAGNVTVFSGMSTQGQGQITTFAQIAAETLGVELDRVRVRLGDTGLVPFGRGAFASRGAIFGGNSVLGAARALKAKVLAAAAALLDRDAASLDMRGSAIVGPGEAATGLTLVDVVRALGPGGQLYAGEPVLEARYVYTADQPATYGLSVHAAKIELDTRTGFVRVLDYLVAHDAGRPLNRMIVDGQIVGGAAEGIGGALFSEMLYDERGQPVTATLADYLVGTAPEIPRVRLAHMETIPGTNPLGVRGIGEGGVIPAGAALTNAVARAIDARRTGFEQALFHLPLTPERVFRACEAAKT